MKIEFIVPDGEFCLDCQHQEGFDINEVECTTFGDASPRYLRTIVANCHLFNKPIEGMALDKMNKCARCRAAAE